MDTLRSFSVLAALSFVGAAYAQTEATVPRTDNQRVATASSPAVSAGMQVRSESGELLGRVSSIIPGDSRNESYVVVGDLQGLATIMPYATASIMTQRDKMVVDRAAFEKAPKMQQTQTEDHSLEGSQRKADEYWKKYAMNEDATGPVRR
jgi:hypothetical protein